MNTAGLIGSIASARTPKIIRGEDYFCTVQISYYEGGRYGFRGEMDQGGQSSTAYFPLAAGGFLTIEGAASGSIASQGLLTFEVPAENTSLLKVGENQGFQVSFRDDAGLCIINMEQVLTIEDPLYY